MRKNLEAAQYKSFEAEQSLRSALGEYVDTFDRERGRPKTMMTKLWQSMQSGETKNLKLEKDLEEILSKMKQMGRKRRKLQDRGYDWKETINKRVLPGIRRSANSEV